MSKLEDMENRVSELEELENAKAILGKPREISEPTESVSLSERLEKCLNTCVKRMEWNKLPNSMALYTEELGIEVASEALSYFREVVESVSVHGYAYDFKDELLTKIGGGKC